MDGGIPFRRRDASLDGRLSSEADPSEAWVTYSGPCLAALLLIGSSRT
jgi:hypothetical protein